jgi:hypothetical protein
MAYLFYRNRQNTRLELVMKDGAPFPPRERRQDWYVHDTCAQVSLALASEIEHFGFVLRAPPEIHVR